MPDPAQRKEVSPGGSVVHRYLQQWFAPKVGFSEADVAEFGKARDEVYGRLFGEPEMVFEEALPMIPRIEVRSYIRKTESGREYRVLATSGMSDLPMKTPAGASPRRVELILYCPEREPEYVETLKFLARFPHDQRTWIGAGHTIPNGNPPAPMWGSPELDTVLLMPSIVKRHQALPDELVLKGDPVEFLWVVPLSRAECELKLNKGFGAVLDLFFEKKHPWIFEPGRKSYL